MPELKPGTVWPTGEEEAAIDQGIADDPDTFELDEQWFKRARPATEAEPDLVERRLGKQDEKPKKFVMVEIDSDIAEHFSKNGGEWKARLNRQLRRSVFGG